MPLIDARVIGPGRAGRSLARALAEAGWRVDGPLGRDHDPRAVTSGARVVFLAVPDGAVAEVARSLAPGQAVVAHLAGSLGLDVLAPHRQIASLHPLVALPDPERGSAALRGAWFATAGDPIVDEAVEALGGRSVSVADADRATYHAAAVVAANHLVALLGQVERLAARAGVPLDAYLDLARGSLDDVARVGPAKALTGPVARGDWDTVARHLEAIPEDERTTYDVLAHAARRIVDESTPTAARAGADR